MIELKLDKNALRNVDQFFSSLTSSEQIALQRRSYMKAVKPMVDTAKNLAPFKTGRLHYSIGAEPGPKGTASVFFGIKTGGVYVGWRGKWVNEGTKPRYWRKWSNKKYTGRVKADNFIRDAYVWNEDNFLNIAEMEMTRYITKQIIKYTQK